MFVSAFIQLLLVLQLFLSPGTACREDGNYSYEDLIAVPPYQPGCDPLALILSHNSISTITSGDFEGYLHVRLVIAAHNQLENLKEGAFGGAINLEKVVLSHNVISHVNNSFSRAPSLRDVHLEYNEIERIDLNSFNEAPTIENIILSFNRISEVSDNTFTHSPNLLTLNLAHNRIERIRGSLFESNTKLRWVDLQNNRLSFLPSELFHSLKSLTYLRLSDNPLQIIKFTFTSPSVVLLADNCGLTELPDIQFGGSGGGVIELDLRENMVNCNCYTVEMTVMSNRTFRCIDEESGQYSPASCFSEDASTASIPSSTDSRQTTPEIGVRDGLTDTHLKSLSYVLPITGVAVIVALVAFFVYRRIRRKSTGGHHPQPV